MVDHMVANHVITQIHTLHVDLLVLQGLRHIHRAMHDVHNSCTCVIVSLIERREENAVYLDLEW